MQNSPQRLKVLTLCSWYPNSNNPTLGNFVKKHAEAASRYNDVICLSIFPSTSDKSIKLEKSIGEAFSEIIVYYPKSKSKLGPWKAFRNFLSHRKAFKQGYQQVESIFGKPDIVHLNITYPLGVWALHLKRKKNIPFVVTENSTGLHIGSNHTYPKHILVLCKRILRGAAVLLPVSEDLKGYMKTLSPNSKFEIISNVVDEDVFKYVEQAKTESQKTFIHISTGLDVHKNISGILSTLSRIAKYRKDFHLQIVSDGDVDYAKEMVSSMNLADNVTFYPTKTTSEIAEMIEKSSALLLFSNYENFPCVIAESLMLGKPVISTNVNGIPEHVHPTNGLLMAKGDENELEKAICTFLDNEIEFNSNEIHSYAFNHFSYQEVGKSFDRVYRQVLKA